MGNLLKSDVQVTRTKVIKINCLGTIKKISREKLYGLILKEEIKLYGNNYDDIKGSIFNQILINLHKIDQIEIFEDYWIMMIFSYWGESYGKFIKDKTLEIIDFFDRI